MRWGWGAEWEEMNFRPPSPKGDGNSAAEPKARRRNKGSITCQTPHVPETLATRHGVGVEEKSEPSVLRVYLRRNCNNS